METIKPKGLFFITTILLSLIFKVAIANSFDAKNKGDIKNNRAVDEALSTIKNLPDTPKLKESIKQILEPSFAPKQKGKKLKTTVQPKSKQANKEMILTFYALEEEMDRVYFKDDKQRDYNLKEAFWFGFYIQFCKGRESNQNEEEIYMCNEAKKLKTYLALKSRYLQRKEQ